MSKVVIDNLSNSKFKDYIEKKVRKTIRKYNLFNRKDKLAVAVSGGKDSTVVLYILKKLGYDVEALTIDVGVGEYSDLNLENIKKVCKDNDIKLNILSFEDEFGKPLKDLIQTFKKKGYEYQSCMVCGILKRHLLNRYAKKMKFDCVITGHNMDDEAQAFMMNVFRNDVNLAIRQGPMPGNQKSKKFVQRVKPLFFITEQEIIRYSKIMKFPVYYGSCPFSIDAYRREFRKILDEFEKKHPSVKNNIIRFQEQMKEKLKDDFKKEADIGTCEICGEPSQNKICKTCKLIEQLEK